MVPFAQEYAEYLNMVETALPGFLPEKPLEEGGLVVEAARYSLLAGGKRIRPVLLLSVSDMFGLDKISALPFACALEIIHTYSLIHDDLPCMDNDDLRRGRPTCHKVYGEAIAILAGDTLLNRAYEIILAAVSKDNAGTLAAARTIACASGANGMIGGQTLDLAAEGKIISEKTLRCMHQMKTGALIEASVISAANLTNAAASIYKTLEKYARAIGLAFQIRDDILDATSNSSAIGKTAGKDQRNFKSTYVTIFGLDDAQSQLEHSIEIASQALTVLHSEKYDTHFLRGLTDYLLVRSA